MFKLFSNKIRITYIFLLRLIIQAVLTLTFAVILYLLLNLSVNRVDFNRVYFPNGQRTDYEQDKSNKYRLEIARTYLRDRQTEQFKIRQNASVSIGIVASDRKNNFYLTQTLGYLFHELKSTTEFPLLVCFVEETTNQEVEDLQKLGINFLFLYRNRSFPEIRPGRNNARINKESFDYWECLNNVGTLFNSDFVLLLEDDALATPNFAIQLDSLVRQLKTNERRRDIDYVKLFHPFYLRKIPYFIQICIVCQFFSFLVQYLTRLSRSNPIFYVNSLCLGFILSIILIKIDKALISDIRFSLTDSVYLTYVESCCTPAILFRATSIPKIVNKLSSIVAYDGHAKDHILDESNFVGRMSDRDFIIHIGYYSTIRQN